MSVVVDPPERIILYRLKCATICPQEVFLNKKYIFPTVADSFIYRFTPLPLKSRSLIFELLLTQYLYLY